MEKGGKYQLQRTNDEEFVKSYFIGKGPDEPIFTKAELNNDLNLHYLRALSAKNYYEKILKRRNENPEYREVLKKEIIDRWNEFNLDPRTNKPKPFNPKKLEGRMYLRGKSKLFAQKKGNPISYDRLCLYSVSLYKLSHFRLNIVVNNYINI